MCRTPSRMSSQDGIRGLSPVRRPRRPDGTAGSVPAAASAGSAGTVGRQGVRRSRGLLRGGRLEARRAGIEAGRRRRHHAVKTIAPQPVPRRARRCPGDSRFRDAGNRLPADGPGRTGSAPQPLRPLAGARGDAGRRARLPAAHLERQRRLVPGLLGVGVLVEQLVVAVDRAPAGCAPSAGATGRPDRRAGLLRHEPASTRPGLGTAVSRGGAPSGQSGGPAVGGLGRPAPGSSDRRRRRRQQRLPLAGRTAGRRRCRPAPRRSG